MTVKSFISLHEGYPPEQAVNENGDNFLKVLEENKVKAVCSRDHTAFCIAGNKQQTVNVKEKLGEERDGRDKRNNAI